MKVRLAGVALCTLLLVPASAAGQNATLEVSQATLNRLVGRLGALSDAGSYQPMNSVHLPVLFEECFAIGFLDCPVGRKTLGFCWKVGGGFAFLPAGDPVTWQWWVTDAHFTLSTGSMTFTANVESRVGSQTNTVTRTVPASVSFDSGSNRLRINIGAFTVPLEMQVGGSTHTITQVDVAQLYRISIPIEPQTLSVALPGGGTRTLTGRAVSVTSQYLSGKILLTVNVGF